MASTPAIRFHDVTRAFGSALALDRFRADVVEGSITALLGRNGAGKTTAIRCALNLLTPDSGHVEVFGTHSEELTESLRAQIGYVGERVTLDPNATLDELCELSAACYPSWDDAYAADLVERLSLAPDRPLGAMSLGESRKAALVLNLAYRPRLLILDEPAGNLDAIVRRDFLEAVIETFTQAGTTVLLSTHLLADVERIADRILLIEAGRCRVDSSLDELCQRVKGLRIPGGAAAREALLSRRGVLSARVFGDDLLVVVEGFLPGAEAEFAASGGRGVDVVDLPLEDIFIAFGTRAATPAAGSAA